MSEHNRVEADSNVVNIDTDHWSPDQVARWLNKQIDTRKVARAVVLVEYDDGGPENDWTTFAYTFSKSTRMELLYIVTYLYRRVVQRYFG